MLYSDEKTHAGFKTALDEVCQVVRPFPQLSAVKDAMDVYKKRHGKEDQRKQQAGSRSVSLLVKTRRGSISDLESYTSCSLRSKRFRAVSGQSGRGRNGIFAFGRAENGSRTKKWKRDGEGKERNDSFLSPPPPNPPPLPHLLPHPFFARSFLLRNHTETIVAQAIPAVYIDVFQIIQNCKITIDLITRRQVMWR